MNKAIIFAAALVVAMIVGRTAVSETRMPQKYNVGGFIHVRGSANHEFKAHSNPAPLANPTREDVARPANSRAIRAAGG